jgi:ribosomal protein S12 methylthiotransferase
MKFFSIISLGCPKNLVDSETFCYIAEKHGYEMSEEDEDIDFVLINTCSFIYSAVQELERVLKMHVKEKSAGRVKKIYVTGCVMRRRLKQVKTKFPEVDAWIDLKDFKHFESFIFKNQ